MFAIEQNKAMREFAQNNLNYYSKFISINGTAEKTTLQEASVYAVSVATAFHWFDHQACKKEFKRILKSNGCVMLLWNLRLPEVSPLLQGYDDILIKHCPEYKGTPSQKTSEQDIISFFANRSVQII